MEQKLIFSREQLDRYFASYVGMEGGNPAGAVWFCDKDPHPWTESLVAPLGPREQPNAWGNVFRARHRDSMERWQSHQKIARIMAAARAETQRRPQSECDWKHYFADLLYAPNGAEFKLSLFPLPAQQIGDTPWSRAFRGQPALVPKQRYVDLCRTGSRFRFISKIRERWRPKIVLCFGERHTDDYVHAFGLQMASTHEFILQPADLAKTLQVLEHDGTTWIICPPLAGASGLTSDVLLEAMGRYISRWLVPADFPRLQDGAVVRSLAQERGADPFGDGRETRATYPATGRVPFPPPGRDDIAGRVAY
ncbi:transcriptional regulator [Ralstonia solanacearum]|nr:transcriptional regulator [Ralstonia solanacearum]